MPRKWMASLLALVIAVTAISGCGGAKPPQTAPPSQTPGGTSIAPGGGGYKVAMSSDIGGLNDDSFNAAAWRGLQRAQTELGMQVKAVEAHRNEDYEVNFRTLMDAGYNLVWGIGFLMHDTVDKMAAQNANQKFGIIDSEVTGRPNVASVLFREEEGSFLMGVIAAKTTKTKTVGFVGGMDFDVIHHFDAGFKAGIKAIDPSIKVLTVYAGAFDDPAKGKSTALSMYGQGADLVFHAAGATGQGVIEAAKEQNKLAIGVDSDQNKLAPQNVISSMVKRVDNAVFDISKAAQGGTFPGGKTTTLGLKEDGVGYAPSTLWNKMPAGTQALVDKWAAAIKAGTVKVPNDPKAVPAWTVPSI
ncbi:MAG: BMP family lipoprotein [Mycobacterium leprae]